MTKKQICKVTGFLLLLAVSVTCVTSILINKWTTVCYESSVPTEFYKLDKNSVEVVFFGSSQVAQGISGMELYEDYGISAYTLGTARQPMLATYAWLKECWKTQKIKTAVLDVASFYYATVPETRYRQAFDNMRLSWNKISSLLKYRSSGVMRDPFFSYIFRISKYHSRWSDLTEEDYTFYLEEQPVFRGNALYSDKVPLDLNKLAYDGDKPQEGLKMNEWELSYVEKFLAFCEENGIDVLLIKTPRTDWNITQHEQVADFAAERGLPFVDLSSMEALTEMEIDAQNDFMDKKHLNIVGAEKLSRYLGAYLKENYDLTDFRDVEGFDELNYEEYLLLRENSEIQLATDPVEYLAGLDKERYDVLIQATAAPGGLYTPELLEALSSFGLQMDFNNGNSYTYVAQIHSGACYYETASGETLKHSGYLSDGVKYTLTSSLDGTAVPAVEVDFEDFTFGNYGLNVLVYDNEKGAVTDRSTIVYEAESGAWKLIKENPRRIIWG